MCSGAMGSAESHPIVCLSRPLPALIGGRTVLLYSMLKRTRRLFAEWFLSLSLSLFFSLSSGSVSPTIVCVLSHRRRRRRRRRRRADLSRGEELCQVRPGE